MALQWGSTDHTANAVIWSPTSVKLPANTTNRDNLFGNTTSDAFITGVTIGTFGVDDNEVTYSLYKIVAALPGANRGDSVLITANSTMQFTANGTGSTNAVINVDTIEISSVAVNAAGQGFVTGDIVSLDEGDATIAATFTVTANASGNVTAIEILEPGSYANASDVPAGDSTTTAVTGSGNSLVVDITTGIDTISIADAGVYTVDPGTTITLTPEGGQTETNVQINIVTTAYNEAQAVPHAGHVLLTEGSGGRAGRFQAETLVCISSMTGDAEDVRFPNT